MHPIRYALMAVGSLLVGNATAQRSPESTELQEFSAQRIRHQKALGYTLGGFALANIAAGSIAASRTTGEAAYFNRMNVYWNLVNLSIAGVGLLASRKQRPTNETLTDAVRSHENFKQILLFNAGLDVAYVAGGAYLQERGNSHPDKADQLRGYGKSVMAQGGFLLAFDLVNYFIFKHRGDKQERLLLAAGPNGVGVTWAIQPSK